MMIIMLMMIMIIIVVVAIMIMMIRIMIIILIIMMMIIIMLIMKIMMMMIVNSAISAFYNVVFKTYPVVVIAQSCANHAQHIGRLSCVTWYVGMAQLFSLKE